MEKDTAYAFSMLNNLSKPPEGEVNTGIMRISSKTDHGYNITEQGFTIEEENGEVLAFDLINHTDLGITLLFGNQVFALKFWDDAQLERGLSIVSKAVEAERLRRKEQVDG